MSFDLADLSRGTTPSPEQIDELLGSHPFPLVDGTRATFVYRGPADRVSLQHWIYGLPSSFPFERVGDSDLWWLEIEIPERSRVEYKFRINRDGRRQLIRDPLNPQLAHDPFGANSVLHHSGYETPSWTLPDEEVPKGSFAELTIDSTAFGERRQIDVYLPARLRPRRRHPLLVVHDGQDYLRYAGLSTVLDNLIARREIEPMVVALIQSSQRLEEYAADPRHGEFLVGELLPLLERELPVRAERVARGLMGASFGAVAALAASWQHPGVFGRLMLQSGSFAFSDVGGPHRRGAVFDPVVSFMRRFRAAPGRPADRMFLSCGVYESLIYENRSLLPLLQATGSRVRYAEARDGHNWLNWRDRLREGLSWLYPGPLWMVYE